MRSDAIRRGLRLALVIMVALALAAPLVACGKRGNLEEPKGEEIPFPRKYPQ